MSQTIQKIKDLAELANAFISEPNQVKTIDAVAEKIILAYKNGNKITLPLNRQCKGI